MPEGWNEETDLHSDCEAAVKDAALLCEELGHTVVEISSDQLDFPGLPQDFAFLIIKIYPTVIDYATI